MMVSQDLSLTLEPDLLEVELDELSSSLNRFINTSFSIDLVSKTDLASTLRLIQILVKLLEESFPLLHKNISIILNKTETSIVEQVRSLLLTVFNYRGYLPIYFYEFGHNLTRDVSIIENTICDDQLIVMSADKSAHPLMQKLKELNKTRCNLPLISCYLTDEKTGYTNYPMIDDSELLFAVSALSLDLYTRRIQTGAILTHQTFPKLNDRVHEY